MASVDLKKWENVTLGGYIRLKLQKWSDSKLTDTSIDMTVTYAKLQNLANSIQFEVDKGEVVNILMPNGLLWVSAFIRLQQLGAVTATSHPLYPKIALELALKATHSRILVTNQDLWDHFKNGLNAPNIHTVYILQDKKTKTGGYKINVDKISLNKKRPMGTSVLSQLEGVSQLLMTSGSTGVPKATMLRHHSVMCNIEAMTNAVPFPTRPHIRITCNQPMAHVGGQNLTLLFTLCWGGHGHLIVSTSTPETIANAIQKYEINYVTLFPSLLAKILAVEDHKTKLSKVRYIITAGATVKPHLLEEAKLCNPKMRTCNIYGSTENGAVYFGDAFHKGLSIKVEHLENKIVGGELLLRSPYSCKGYLDDNEKTKESFTEDGWFKTGDEAHIDPETGAVEIKGRMKDIIKVNEQSVSSLELEAIISEIEGVVDCAVIGHASDEYGEIPIAFIVNKSSISKENVMKWVEERVPVYKRIHDVKFLDVLPMNANNKCDKQLLKTMV